MQHPNKHGIELVAPVEEDMALWHLTEMRPQYFRLLADIIIYGKHKEAGARILKGLWERFLNEEIDYFWRVRPAPDAIGIVVLEHLTEIRVILLCEPDPRPPLEGAESIAALNDSLARRVILNDEDFDDACRHTRALIALAPEEKAPPPALRT